MKNSEVVNFIEKWRARQKPRPWTKAHLSRKMGVTRSYITKVESGDRTPSLKRALQMAEELRCPVEKLFKRVAKNP